MEITRTFDLLKLYEDKYVKDDVLAGKEDGKWVKYSSKDYINYSNLVSYGLLALGYKKGDKIATITNNRPEWNFMDMGLAQIGIVHVPIYPTISTEDYKYILKHSAVKAVIISGKLLLSKLESIVTKQKSIKMLYSFDKIDGIRNWNEIIKIGQENKDKYENEVEQIKNSISKDELATIIYTSGTTGNSKGVMLSHYNLISNAIACSFVHNRGFEHKTLSFLPLSHVYERMMNYNFQYTGVSIYYAENLGTISRDLNDVKPHIFNTVPRLLEKVYDGIIGKGKNLPYIKKTIFFWAVKLGLRYRLNNKHRYFYNFKLRIARKLIFRKWKEALGNKDMIIVSGGAALQERLERIFWAAGIPVFQGYGLTETSPVIAVNNQKTLTVKFGTVGKALRDIKIKINEDGEILSKGPNTMLGYYKEPNLTKEIIDNEGWLHTGDIGDIDNEGFLKITDRKKEMFKTSAGKYIAPQVIENKMKESFFIEQAMVIGENEKFASALLSPNFQFLHDWCSIHKIQYRDNKELINIPEVIKRFQKEVTNINKQLGDTERISRFRLVCNEWNPQTGELSPTQKLKRNVISEKYDHIISEIYQRPKKQNGIIPKISVENIKEGIITGIKNGIGVIKNNVPKL